MSADTAARLIAAAADVALVVDKAGVIKDVAWSNGHSPDEGSAEWLGRRWVETVTIDSRPKVEELLREAAADAAPRWREVNHPSRRGNDLLVSYSAVPLGAGGRIVAFGRSLKAVAQLQQQLVDAQQSMEREYNRLRHAETRYRLLFQLASEAVLIVEATTQKVVEANPAAGLLIGTAAGRIVGRALPSLFAADGVQPVLALLARARAAGRADEIRARLADSGEAFMVSASLFRQDNAAHILVRLTPMPGARAEGARGRSSLLKVIETLPDALVVTGADRRILEANPAFLDMAQIATDEQARGEPLDRWLGRPGVDIGVIVANLREHGAVRNFGTIVRGELGLVEEVEVSAVAVAETEEVCFGFMIRHVGRRNAAEPEPRALPRSAGELADLVGRVAMKDIVRETTDVIERLCIEAALKLTNDNRASAAQMLGLSRQSLYAKLRRFGLGDLDADAGEE